MVYITGSNGITRKFACQTCIKGHRSTRCAHADRELVEIKRKGRPLSQCDECRALRKTKRVHIKCICNRSSSVPDEIRAASSDQPAQLNSPQSGDDAFQGGGSFASLTPCTCCSQLVCTCFLPATPDTDPTMSPTSSLQSPLTPDDIIAQHKILPPLSSMILPPIRLPPPPRNRLVPIHDPTDDIDSDTPIFKPNENNALDRVAVLGELSHTSSEDLMKQIYSPFLEQSPCKRQVLTNDDETPISPDEERNGMRTSDRV